MVIFDNFSNSLQAARYCLGYQNTLNEVYLKGFGCNLRPRTWFSHLYSMLEISRFWLKSAFTPISPLTPQNGQKTRFFDHFSNSLQARRYYLGYPTTLNLEYLKALECNLKPTMWFPHLYLMLEVSRFWLKSAFTPISPLPPPPKMNKKTRFLIIFLTPSEF